MPGIFICYRREDSDAWAGRIRDRLRKRFRGRVFMDIDSIPSGADYRQFIDARVLIR